MVNKKKSAQIGTIFYVSIGGGHKWHCRKLIGSAGKYAVLIAMKI